MQLLLRLRAVLIHLPLALGHRAPRGSGGPAEVLLPHVGVGPCVHGAVAHEGVARAGDVVGVFALGGASLILILIVVVSMNMEAGGGRRGG